ncbi:MAG: type II toxin-antitoxin system HipA family toxin [Candidatus Dormibacterales bacterium]
MSERLSVVYETQVVATLERQDDGTLELSYTDLAYEIAEGRVLLSASLPVRRDPYGSGELMPFFDGLLPEQFVRQRLATRLRLEPGDVFGFLREIGRECAGAFSVIPEGVDPIAAQAEGVAWLSDDELAAAVSDLPSRPLGVEPSQDIRISLAGAQDKLVVVVAGGRIGLPRGTTPSTHILKPTSQLVHGRRRQRAFPGLVANEAFCMRLGDLSGLNVPPVELMMIDREPALIIKRYDREISDGRIRRLHQEDFCQALGVPSYRKYQKDDGPGLPEYLNLIGRYSSKVVDDEPELIARIAFNYVIGNADAHAKNFALLYPELGVARLAPAYDLVSTHVYSHLTHDMATSINGMYDSRALQPVHWQKELSRLGLRERLYSERLNELADRVEAALPKALDWIAAEGVRNRITDSIAGLVNKRLAVLRGVRELPAPTSRAERRGGPAG